MLFNEGLCFCLQSFSVNICETRNNINLCVVLDETEHGFGSEYAFIYSDNLVIIR